MSLLVELPVVSSLLGNFEEISQGVLHLSFNVTEIGLYSTIASENLSKWHEFSCLRMHTSGILSGIWLPFSSKELKSLHTVEAISNVLIDLGRVVTVGEDIKQGLI
jgi:hypothetical protein